MKDTKNLIRKVRIKIPKLIRNSKEDKQSILYWESQKDFIENQLDQRNKNRLKNIKQAKKNGKFITK